MKAFLYITAFGMSFQALMLILSLMVGQFAAAAPKLALSPEHNGEVYCNALLSESHLKMTPEGLNLFVETPTATIKDHELTRLRLASFNVFNLEWMKGKFVEDPSTGEKIQVARQMRKDPAALQEIANIILREDPDIMALQEVEDGQALERLNSHFLNGKYIVLLVEGNDGRGIDVGFLIKRNLPFDIEIQSHRFVKDKYKSQTIDVFSRDLPVVTFWPQGSNRRGRPYFSFIGTHFKSQRDKRNDPRSEQLRTLQVKNSQKIISDLQNRYGPDYVVFMGGDYNADLHTAPEFQQLWNAGFKDSLDLQSDIPSRLERVTQTYHPHDGPTVKSQMDGILLAPTSIQDAVIQSSMVIPYLLPNGSQRPLPETYDERGKQPSDHRMVQTDILFQMIYDM